VEDEYENQAAYGPSPEVTVLLLRVWQKICTANKLHHLKALPDGRLGVEYLQGGEKLNNALPDSISWDGWVEVRNSFTSDEASHFVTVRWTMSPPYDVMAPIVADHSFRGP